MKLYLTKKEYKTLLPLLEGRIAEYYTEIRHAILSPYKDGLKQRKIQLVALREMLENTSGASVDLTTEHASALADLLAEFVREVSSELWHTDNSVWRDGLKEEKRTLEGLLSRVSSATATDALP